MGKYNIVPWFLSISVPIGMAWIAGFAISSSRHTDDSSKQRARVSSPQLAAPLLNLSQISSQEKTEAVKQEELAAPVISDAAREVSEAAIVEPLRTLTVKTDDGLTRTVKIYEDTSDDSSP